LQVLESGAVEALDALGRPQVAVRDDARQGSRGRACAPMIWSSLDATAVAAADRDDRGAHVRQAIDPP